METSKRNCGRPNTPVYVQCAFMGPTTATHGKRTTTLLARMNRPLATCERPRTVPPPSQDFHSLDLDDWHRGCLEPLHSTRTRGIVAWSLPRILCVKEKGRPRSGRDGHLNFFRVLAEEFVCHVIRRTCVVICQFDDTKKKVWGGWLVARRDFFFPCASVSLFHQHPSKRMLALVEERGPRAAAGRADEKHYV